MWGELNYTTDIGRGMKLTEGCPGPGMTNSAFDERRGIVNGIRGIHLWSVEF